MAHGTPEFKTTNHTFNKHLIRLGKWLGILAYLIDKRHRRIVRANLELAFPSWSPEYVRDVSKCVFMNMGMMAFEILQANTFSRQKLIDFVNFDENDALNSMLSSSKGGIIISAHFGNWEIGLLYLSCLMRKKMISIVRPIDNKYVDRWLLRFRTRFGNTVIDKRKSLSHLRKALRKGCIIGTMIDQEPKSLKGLPVKFFGKDVSATGAVALLARRYDVPIIPVFCVRKKDGTLTLITYPPAPMQKTSDAKKDLIANTQTLTDIVEKVIREYPGEWFWAHKRWKKHYPYLYPDLAHRERKRALKKIRASSKIKKR